MSSRTKQTKSYLGEECITDTTIDNELLLLIHIDKWYILNRPVMMPNGTWSNWSRILHSTTKNDSLIPTQTKTRFSHLWYFN